MRGTRAVAAAAAIQLLPSVTTLGPVRRLVAPRLSGIGAPGHVALTFDDGPHPVATPQLLDLLAERRTTATFFVLGEAARAHPDVVARAAENHEIAVHGWTHRCHLYRTPFDVAADLRRTRDLIGDLTGTQPRYWRPPYGIASGPALVAARRLGLTPVLWTADGRDWTAQASPASIVQRIRAGLRDGGTVLLHDSDATSATGSWIATLAAVPVVLDLCAELGWRVGPVRDHFDRSG